MILKLSLHKPLRETNPDIDFEDWFGPFAQLEQKDERFCKAIILFFDFDSPLGEVSDLDQRFEKVQKVLDFSDQEIADFRKSIAYPTQGEEIHQLIYEAIPDYTQYQTDVARQLKQGLEYQVTNISKQLYSENLDIKSDKDEKAIDRFQKFSEKSYDIYKNIANLASYEHKDYEEIKVEVEEALAQSENEKDSTGVKGINEAKKQAKKKVRQNGK